MTAIWSGTADADGLRSFCEDQAGLTLGVGLALEADKNLPTQGLFRIGHMGHLSPPMIMGTLGTIDSALKTLGIAHGEGALEAASAKIAGHFAAAAALKKSA